MCCISGHGSSCAPALEIVAQRAEPLVLQIGPDTVPQLVEVTETRIRENAKCDIGVGHGSLRVAERIVSVIVNGFCSCFGVVASEPDSVLRDGFINIHAPHLQRTGLSNGFAKIDMQHATSRPVRLQVICPGRDIIWISRLFWVVRAPPRVVTDDDKISSGQTRGQRIILARPMLLLRLLARERDEHDYAAFAPKYVVRETHLANLVRRRLHQPRGARYPRLRHEWRIVASPRAFR